MSYPRELMVGAVVAESNWYNSAQSLTQAAAVYGVYNARKPFVVQEVSMKISTAVNNLTNSVVAAEVVTALQNATPVTTPICTLTIPNGATAATVFYNNGFTPALVPAGANLQFRLKTQGGLGGTPAGAGFLGFYATFSPEENTNVTPSNTMIKLSV